MKNSIDLNLVLVGNVLSSGISIRKFKRSPMRTVSTSRCLVSKMRILGGGASGDELMCIISGSRIGIMPNVIFFELMSVGSSVASKLIGKVSSLSMAEVLRPVPLLDDLSQTFSNSRHLSQQNAPRHRTRRERASSTFSNWPSKNIVEYRAIYGIIIQYILYYDGFDHWLE
uniref:Uncharacterized protein n=1 Tax=Glossina austeni TaxID=7395 RepID=A0A1A9UT08_GLOAU